MEALLKHLFEAENPKWNDDGSVEAEVSIVRLSAKKNKPNEYVGG